MSAAAPDLLSRLRAQDGALRTLQRALGSGRVHHAYLFTGPDGVGKELAAFGLAQALVCERRAADTNQGGLFGAAPPAPADRACGACSACVRAVPRIEERTPVHPDVIVLERGLYAPATIGRRTAESQDISVDQVRTLVLARAAYAPHEGRAKVIIVRRAEELSESAANALLKTLEEPGDRTHFVLVTSQPDALLPTIRSRTLTVRFAPLPDDVVLRLLVEEGIPEERAADATRLAGGSLEQARVLVDPAESDIRHDFLTRAFEALEAKTVMETLTFAEDAKKAKDRLPALIVALASQLSAKAAAAAREGHADAERHVARGRLALAAIEQLAGNASAQLVVEAMLTKMRAL